MNVINRPQTVKLKIEHPGAVPALDDWWRKTRRAKWASLQDCRKTFRTADQVGRVLIFDLAGNRYRLITVVSWRNQRVFVKALLTHTEYERNLWHKWAF